MKKFGLKIKLSIVLILLASLVILFSPAYVAYASLSDQGTNFTFKTQSTNPASFKSTMTALNTRYNLYGNATTTEQMYTIKATNCASIDNQSYVDPVATFEYVGDDYTIHTAYGSSTSTSKRNSRVSTIFSISNGLKDMADRNCLVATLTAQVKSNKENVAVGFYNGSYSSTDYSGLSSTSSSRTTSAETSSSWSTKTLALGNDSSHRITTDTFMVVFVTERTSGDFFGRKNQLYVKTPYITFTSLDTIAPNVSDISFDNTWVNANKTITLTVADNHGGSQTYMSGIKSVTVNGTALTATNSNNNNVNTYEFTASPNVDEYTVVMTDASGNSATRTYNKTDFRIDTVDVNTPSITMDDEFASRHIVVNSSYVFDNLSAETLHYELHRHGENEVLQTGTLNFGTDSFDIEDNGVFDVVYYATDAVGHGSNTTNTVTRTFNVNEPLYEIHVNIINGTLENIVGAEARLEGGVYKYYSLTGKEVEIRYTCQAGYTYATATHNGNNIDATHESCTITTTGSDNVNIRLKYVLSVEDYVDEYVFNKDGGLSPIYYFDVDENIQNSLDVALTYSGKGTELYNAGNYTVTWSCENDNYIGSGTFDIDVVPSPQTMTYTGETTFRYTGVAHTVSYVPFEDFEIELRYYIGDINTDLINAGNYILRPVSLDENYVIINSDITVVVLPIELYVNITENDYTYTSNPIRLTYNITDENGNPVALTDADMDYSVGGNITDIINAGVYMVGFRPKNSNYEVSVVMNNTIVVAPKPTYVTSVNDYTYTGEIQTFVYTLSEDIESEYTVDDILNVGEYEYSIVSLNANYVVILENNTFTVLPMQIDVLDIVNEYTYNGEEIDIEYTLSREISHTFASCQAGEITPLINVGEYNIEFVSTDANYVIINNEKIVEIVPLQIVVDVVNDTFVYNGENNNVEITINGTPNYTINYYIGGELTTDTSMVGEYDWTLVLDDDNYVGSATGHITVEKRTAYVIAHSGQAKSYGDAEGVLTYDVENLVNDDNVEVLLSRAVGESVGVYYIDIESFSSDRYVLDYSGAYFKITPKNIIVVAEKKTKTYSDADPELTYKIVMNGVMVDHLIGDDVLSGSLTRVLGENVGSYDILLGTITHSNYSILYKSSTLEIVPMDVVIDIDDKYVTYGESAELTYTIVTPCDESGITGNITRVAGDTVGEYAITAGTLDSDNYNLIVNNGVYTIGRKNATITAHASYKVYGETETLEYDTVGLINGDTLSGSLTRVVGENVGTYDILVGTLNNDNYNLEYVGNVLTITKAEIGIIIDSKSQVYGGVAVPFTYSITGLKNDDRIGVQIWRAEGNNAGEYEISYQLSNDDNYTVVNVNIGVYTITRAASSLHLVNDTCVYDGKAHTITTDEFDGITYVYKLNGFVVDEMVNAGVYEIQAFFDGNANYNGCRSNVATLTIEKQQVYITLGDNNFVYDGETKFPIYYYDKNTGVLDSNIVYEFENDIIPVEVGEYNFRINIIDDNFAGSVSGIIRIENKFVLENDNYSVESADATFSERARSVSLVKLDADNKYHGQKVLSKYTLVSDTEEEVSDNKCVYTIKVKANGKSDQAYIYRVNGDEVTQIAVSKEDGYYVFKVDRLGDEFIITEDFEPVNMGLIIAISVGVLLLGIIIVGIIIRSKKRKKESVKVSDVPTDTYNVN